MGEFDNNSEPYDILAGVFVPLTTISLALRFVARWKKSVHVGLDDWLAVLAYVIWIGYVGVLLWMAKNTNGFQIEGLPLDRVIKYLKGFYVVPMLTVSLMTAAKFSILTLYLRLFGADKRFRLSVWIVGALCLAWWIAAMLATSFKCWPVESSWDPRITGDCIDYSAFAVGIEVPNSILDFVIGGIAIHVVRGLQLNVWQKLGISFIFVLGTFVGVIGFVRIGITYNPEHFNVIDTAIWIPIQNAFALFCCSFPTYKPLLPNVKNPIPQITSRFHMSRSGTTHQSSSAFNSQVGETHAKSNLATQQSRYLYLPGGDETGSTNFTWVGSGERSSPGSESAEDQYPMGRIGVKNTVELDTQRMV